ECSLGQIRLIDFLLVDSGCMTAADRFDLLQACHPSGLNVERVNMSPRPVGMSSVHETALSLLVYTVRAVEGLVCLSTPVIRDHRDRQQSTSVKPNTFPAHRRAGKFHRLCLADNGLGNQLDIRVPESHALLPAVHVVLPVRMSRVPTIGYRGE